MFDFNYNERLLEKMQTKLIFIGIGKEYRVMKYEIKC